jgi:hypothetical protein
MIDVTSSQRKMTQGQNALTPVFDSHDDVQFRRRDFALLQMGMCWTLGLCDGDPDQYENDTFPSLRGCVT